MTIFYFEGIQTRLTKSYDRAATDGIGNRMVRCRVVSMYIWWHFHSQFEKIQVKGKGKNYSSNIRKREAFELGELFNS